MNAQPHLFPICAAIALLAVSGCASLSENDCRSASWSDIGFRDGRHGKPDDRINDHAKACSKYSIAPDRTAYFSGREAGLTRYCTQHNGLEVGRSGDTYENVCPRGREDEFLSGYTLGQAIHRATARLSEVDSDIAHVEKELKASDEVSDADRETLTRQRIELEGERGAAQEALRRLEWEAESM